MPGLPTIGPFELVIVLVLALLILGPGKLPEVGSALGRTIRDFRHASSDIDTALKPTKPLPGRPIPAEDESGAREPRSGQADHEESTAPGR